MMIPTTDITNPLYKPKRPSDLKILDKQSVSPVNYLSAPFPISAAKRVLAKSRG